jgi:hypothetical protein
MADLVPAYSSFAGARGLVPVGAVSPGPLTPLLAESTNGLIEPAATGALPDGGEGTLGHLEYTRNRTFHFSVALTEVPESSALAPRVFCIRRGRRTRDDEFYGFEARYSKLWTESIALDERYVVSTSPFQDPSWLRQLFSPAFVDYLASEPPGDFSFELCYGAVLCSVEGEDVDAARLADLWAAASRVTERIRSESAESL